MTNSYHSSERFISMIERAKQLQADIKATEIEHEAARYADEDIKDKLVDLYYNLDNIIDILDQDGDDVEAASKLGFNW